MTPAADRTDARHAGFTLAEVLAAVFVLALLGSLVSGVLVPGAEWSATRVDRGFAHRAACSSIEALLAREFETLQPGHTGPIDVSGHPDATVEIAIRQFEPGVKELVVTAVAGDQEVALSCLKGRRRL